MKYFLIAGEASGDMHGAHLIEALKRQDPTAELVGLGGDLMQEQGMTLVQHYREMAFMGFVAVVRHLPQVMGNMRKAKEAILRYQPDVLILIDYPSFNLRIARFAKKNLRCEVCYYISPKLWAWKAYRIKDIRRYVDKMYTIFPFETDYYAQHNYKVNYVGNPTQETIDQYLAKPADEAGFRARHGLDERPIIALLAGSRHQEISACLPKMVKVAKQFPHYQAIIAGAPGVENSLYGTLAKGVKVVSGCTYDLLRYAAVAVVNSGTATLETALLNVPQVVVYHVMGGRVSYFLKECFIHTRYISLVNIIAGREVVRELIAHLFTEENLYKEIKALLTNEIYRGTVREGYADVRKALGKEVAAENTAQDIVNRNIKKRDNMILEGRITPNRE